MEDRHILISEILVDSLYIRSTMLGRNKTWLWCALFGQYPFIILEKVFLWICSIQFQIKNPCYWLFIAIQGRVKAKHTSDDEFYPIYTYEVQVSSDKVFKLLQNQFNCFVIGYSLDKGELGRYEPKLFFRSPYRQSNVC